MKLFNAKDNPPFATGWRVTGPKQERDGRLLDVLIFVPGLALAGLVLAIHYYGVRNRTPLFTTRWLLLLTIPSAVGLISAVCRWKTTRFIALALVAFYWSLLVLLGGISLQGFALFGWLLAPLTVLFLIAVYTTVFAGIRTGITWVFLAVLFGMTSGGVMFADKVHHWEEEKGARTSTALDPYPLGPDMVTINKCTHLFRLLHPEAGYPESLQQVGPHGSGCLTQALLESRQKGFSVTYRGGEKDSEGRVAGYTVTAEQPSPHGPDFNVMSSDESGLILITFQGPHGKGGLYAYAPPADSFEFLARCLRESMAEYKMSAESADRAVQRCWGESRFGVGYITSRGRLTSRCFEMTYKFVLTNAGMMDGFNVTGRPVTYGECGIRSYLIEARASTMRMYVTAENRPASRSDPLAKMCELQTKGNCRSPAEIN